MTFKTNTVRDDRTPEQKASTRFYANATDRFMSGWGHMRDGGVSYFCVACDNATQLHMASSWLQQRGDMVNVREAHAPRRGRCGTWDTKVIHFTESGACPDEAE